MLIMAKTLKQGLNAEEIVSLEDSGDLEALIKEARGEGEESAENVPEVSFNNIFPT